MDGSSGHIYIKKIFTRNSNRRIHVCIAFVSLMLIDKSSKTVAGKNPSPSSSLYCRPLKFLFSKENENLVKQEYNEFENNFQYNIDKMSLRIGEREFHVDFEFHLTMIDSNCMQYCDCNKVYCYLLYMRSKT